MTDESARQSAPSSVMAPAPFAPDGRRLLVYVVYDRRGELDPFVEHALRGLREHCAHIIAVVNGSITDEARTRLAAVSDDILVRSNRGYDIWAHKEGMERVGDLSRFDEVVLANDTWFGPVRPYGPVFERMDATAVHLWGMTDHAEQTPNPFTGEGRLPWHLQSFWLAARRELFLGADWEAYWRNLPAMDRYEDAVLLHETVFTEHFTTRGYTALAAYPSADYPTDHPALFNADLLLADGCPLLKRRPFFHYPPFLNRHAVIGRELIQAVEGHGYPVELIWQNLSRNVPPRTLNANAGMLEVLPEVDLAFDPSRPQRIAAVVNVVHEAMADELLDRISYLPDPVDVFVTTPVAALVDALRARLDAREGARFAHAEVRLVSTRRGRHMSAFLLGCADVIVPGRYDLIVKIHSKRSRSKPYNVSRYFARHQLENLLSSPGYVRNLLALFQRERGLGVVFPPTMHIGLPMLGSGWSTYRNRVEALLSSLGVRVPLDEVSPLAPMGGMWIARPEAMRKLTEYSWSYADYRDDPAHPETRLAAAQERAIAYVAGESGYHCRTVLNAEHAAISHTALEFGLDQLSSTTPGYPIEQIQFLHRAGWMSHGGAVPLTMMYLRMNHPRAVRVLDPLYRVARSSAIRAKSAVAGVRGRR